VSSIARTAATGGDLDPSFFAWQTSLPFDRRLLPEDLEGSRAHVRGLLRAGLVTRDEADRLLAGLAELADEAAAGRLTLPDEEDVHMAVERCLRERLGAVADKLHTGRSRNDQVATDLALWSRRAVRALQAAIDDLLAAAERLAQRHGDVPMPAYTHRQVAIGVLAATWIDAALGRPLARDRRLLDAVLDELDECPLGAGAIAGTTLPLDREATAADLGFSRGPTNPMDAVGARDGALALVFACQRILSHLARFAADMVELCADGLWALDGAIACGSSMMPHKKNPDLFELVRGRAALGLGDLAALAALFHGLGTGYHRDLQYDKIVLFRAIDGTRDALAMITLSLGHVAPDADACRRALERGDAIATDLTELLVARGVPFREAYRRVGALVAAQRAKGARLVDLRADELTEAGFPAEAASLLDVAHAARRRAARWAG